MRILKNEGGFILPLCLIISFLFIAFVLYQIESLQNDRLFFHERVNYFVHDTHFQMAAADILSALAKLDIIDDMDGNLTYHSGQVSFSVTVEDEMTATIALASSTSLPGKRHVAFKYDHTWKRMTQWSEGM